VVGRARIPQAIMLEEFPDLLLPNSMQMPPPRCGAGVQKTTTASGDKAPQAIGGDLAWLENSKGDLGLCGAPVVCCMGLGFMVGAILKVSLEAYSCLLCCGYFKWPKRVSDVYGKGVCED